MRLIVNEASLDLISIAAFAILRFRSAMQSATSDLIEADRLESVGGAEGHLGDNTAFGAVAMESVQSTPWWKEHWFLVIAATVMALPGLVSLTRNYWSTEQGAAGPIILLTGLWLLHHEAKGARDVQDRAAGWLVPLGLIVMGVCTVTASVTSKQWLQLLGIYLSLALVLYGVIGLRQWSQLRAPILYLAFVIPPPDNLAVPLTRSLKELVANASIDFLALLGYPAARDGVLLYIGQYELVVAAACSGMNSIISLTAIGLFYVYLLHRAHVSYAALLALLMIPVALFANAVRVMGLLLITYYAGDAAGQGILHEAAGLFIFIVALSTLVAIDRLLAPILLRPERP
jgi:exosortase